MNGSTNAIAALGTFGGAGRVVTAPRFCFRVAAAGPSLTFAAGTVTELPLDARSCRLPGAPAWLAGVLNRHGALFPVFDLARWCGLPPESERRRVTLLVGSGDEGAGILSDGEPFVLQLPPLDAVHVADAAGAPAALLPYLRGCARLADACVVGATEVANPAPTMVFELDHRRWLRDAGRTAAQRSGAINPLEEPQS